jgi:hypothetical protein
MIRLRGWTALPLAAGLLVGCGLAGCGSPGSQSPGISVPQLPPPLPDGRLNNVDAVTANAAWAAGYSCGPGCTARSQRTLILRWDGTRWTQVRSPSPGISSVLGGISVASEHDAWAVGDTCTSACGTGAEVDRSLILHWNGIAWTTTASPPGNAHLYGVRVAPGGTAWAVGSTCSARCGTTTAIVQSLILRWDGTSWQVAATPVPGGELASVAVGPGGTAWAVGDVCVSLCDASVPVTQTLSLYWDGSAWRQEASPNPGGAAGFTGVAAGPGGTAWAVGVSCAPNCGAFQDIRTLMAEWNGSWSEVGTPTPGLTISIGSGASGDWIAGLACATGCGTDAETLHTLLMRWTGTSWSPVPSPTPYPVFGLLSVSANAAGPVGAWAVGYSCTANCGAATEIDRPLILHWTGLKWLVSS